MEFKALIEKLDWKGNVVQTVRKYDDAGFKPDMTRFFREAIETGEIKTKELPTPNWTWDHSIGSITKEVARAKSQYYFKETEPGIRMIAGEFYPALDAQFMLFDRGNFAESTWIKISRDVFQEAENGV